MNFAPASLLQIPPIAPGPHVPDAFTSNGNGRGITWGLMHLDAKDEQGRPYKKLARFDCDLSLDIDDAFSKRIIYVLKNQRFQSRIALPNYIKKRILDRDKSRFPTNQCVSDFRLTEIGRSP